MPCRDVFRYYKGNRDKHFANELVDYLLETSGRRDDYPSGALFPTGNIRKAEVTLRTVYNLRQRAFSKIRKYYEKRDNP